MNVLFIASIITFITSGVILNSINKGHKEVAEAWKEHYKLTKRESKKGTALITLKDGRKQKITGTDRIQERRSGRIYLLNKWDEVNYIAERGEVVSMEFSPEEDE